MRNTFPLCNRNDFEYLCFVQCLKILKLSLKAKSLLEGSTGGQHPQIMDEWRQLKDRLKLWLQQSRVPVAENEQVYQDGSEKAST